ncbi:hypothetical protein VNO77_27327 [Canavalia gladiata]|uniref:Uncharacterized protein n=1 Tax=Canavalia gladiata TaxID=3824 RepID=A0AAN9KVK8_CANGL
MGKGTELSHLGFEEGFMEFEGLKRQSLGSIAPLETIRLNFKLETTPWFAWACMRVRMACTCSYSQRRLAEDAPSNRDQLAWVVAPHGLENCMVHVRLCVDKGLRRTSHTRLSVAICPRSSIQMHACMGIEEMETQAFVSHESIPASSYFPSCMLASFQRLS